MSSCRRCVAGQSLCRALCLPRLTTHVVSPCPFGFSPPQCRPGEEVEITGVYTHNFDASLNTRQGFPVFATVVEANFVQKRQDAMAIYQLTEDDKLKIAELSRDPNIADRVRHSVAIVPVIPDATVASSDVWVCLYAEAVCVSCF